MKEITFTFFKCRLQIQSNLVNTTLVYTTLLVLRLFARPNFLVQNSLFYTTPTLDNATFKIPVLSYLRGS